jgi:hypothetical protein
MTQGVEGNYAQNHSQTSMAVLAADAAVNEFAIGLPQQNGIEIRLGELRYDNFLTLTLGANDTYQAAFIKNREKVGSFVIDSGDWAAVVDTAGSKPIMHLIPEYIAGEGYDTIKLTVLRGDGEYKVSSVGIQTINGEPQTNAVNIINFEIKQMEITISEKNYEAIKYDRDKALSDKRNLFYYNTDANIKLSAEGQEYDVKCTLKAVHPVIGVVTNGRSQYH